MKNDSRITTARKPHTAGKRTTRPFSERSGEGLERSTLDAEEMGASNANAERRDTGSPLADSLPAGTLGQIIEAVEEFPQVERPEEFPSYKPTEFYWRQAIRRGDRDALFEIAMALVSEFEIQRAFIRELGWMPPKAHAHPDEMREKGWLDGSGECDEV